MATGARSTKRRKLSSPDEDARPPPKTTLKRPTRRNATSETSSATGRRRAAKDLDDPDVYDDFDSAFGDTPGHQLQTEAANAATRAKPAAQPKKKAARKPKASDSQKENIPEPDPADVSEEPPAKKPAKRLRTTRTRAAVAENTDAGAEKEETASPDELGHAHAQPRRGDRRAKAAPEETNGAANGRASSAKTTRRAKQTEVHKDEEPSVEEPVAPQARASRTKAPAKPKATTTKRQQEKPSLLDLVGNDDKSGEDSTREMTPEPKPSTTPKKRTKTQASDAVAKKASITQLQVHPPDEGALAILKSIVLGRITGKKPTALVGLDDEYRKAHQLVEQTVNSGEGNSMLIIGARGSGKTVMVNHVLSDLSKEQRQDFHIIRLNGFIHTDDKLALREIWRQLGREMEIEEDSMGKNYADTLSTLLALLSHPSELAGQDSGEIAKAVIFIMDEFDLFASHPRQTLLYNLFDIAQSRKAPITVLGLTTRIGVAENLEKRVKSRFSHRYVHLSLAKTFASFREMCKAALIVKPEDLDEQERASLTAVPSPKAQKSTKTKNRTSKAKQTEESTGFLTTWNDSVKALFSDPSFLQTYLAPHYHLNKSVPSALSMFHLPISILTPATLALTAAHFTTAKPATAPASHSALLGAPDSKLSLLPSLSDLGLALIIAAARLDIIHDADTCNFNMAYAEYVSLASRAKIASAAGGALAAGATGTKVWGRDVARAEWERLVRWELLMPVINGGGSGGGIDGGSADSAMVRCDVALEEIAPSVGAGLDRVLERWCRHI